MEASVAPAPLATARGAVRFASPRLLRLASDDRLVAYARAGSQAAYEVIYDRHHAGILSFCRHMLGTREEAEDAVQHAFMAAYRDLVTSDKPIQLRAWLYAVARNRCLSMLRARRERPSADLAAPVTDGLATEVQQRADLQDVLRDLAGLPDDQRAALVLSELGDMAHDEIGSVLGCPREKVKALVFQARTSLQRSRAARETSCLDIRRQLSTLTGGSLRRSELRRHVGGCPGCREFEAEVKRQRRAMAAVLPVVPTLALKDSALAAAFSGSVAGGTSAVAAAGAGGATAVAAAGAGGASAVAAKALVVAALASGGGAAGYSVVTDGREAPAAAPAPSVERPARPDAQRAGTQHGPASGEAARDGDRGATRRGREDSEPGARGRANALTRGKGRKRGLLNTQPGRTPGEKRAAAREKHAAAGGKHATAGGKGAARARDRAPERGRHAAPPPPVASPSAPSAAPRSASKPVSPAGNAAPSAPPKRPPRAGGHGKS